MLTVSAIVVNLVSGDGFIIAKSKMLCFAVFVSRVCVSALNTGKKMQISRSVASFISRDLSFSYWEDGSLRVAEPFTRSRFCSAPTNQKSERVKGSATPDYFKAC